ncbi:MAG TPA: hypothetical protein VGM76_18335 [Lacipirellulaceae bacterium]|jgi:hypothetical protein
MAERIKQVLITYVTHRYILAACLAGVVLFVVPNLIAVSRNHPSTPTLPPPLPPPVNELGQPELSASVGRPSTFPSQQIAPSIAPQIMMLIGMPLLFLASFLVGHAKTQFAHSRARLTPDFIFAHIAVLAAILFLLLVAYPMLIAWCAHAESTSLVAIALAIAAPSIWGIHRGRVSWFFVSLGAFYSLFTERGANFWIIDAEQNWTVHVLIAVAGAVLIAAWLRRLCQLREELDDYQTNIQWGVSRPGGGEAIEQRRLQANQARRSPLITWISDNWLARLPAVPPTNRGMQLPRLLLYGFSPWPMELQAIWMALAMGAMTLFMANFAFSKPGSNTFPIHMFLFFATVMPGWIGGLSLAQRRPRIATELLRPLTRCQLMDSLFAAAARNSIVHWLIMNAGLLFVAWLVLRIQITAGNLIMYVLLSATATFAAWGLSVRTAVWSSPFLRILVMMIVFGLSFGVAAGWLAKGEASSVSVLIAAMALVAIGAALVASARKAWLNLELG